MTVYWGPADGGTNKWAWAYTNKFGTFDGSVTLPAWYTTNVALPASDKFYYYRYEAENGGPAVWASPAVHFLGGEVWVDPTTVATAESVGGGVATPVPGTVTVWRASQATNEDTVVNFTLSGSATIGVDFTISPSATSATIPAGAASTDVIITPIFDRSLEGNETVTLTLNSGAYAIGSPSASTVTIADNTVIEPVDLYWDNQAGNGQWDKTSSNWHRTGDPDGSDRFIDGDSAYFTGAAGTVTLAESLLAGTVQVSGTGAWTWNSSGGSALTVTNSFTYGGSGSSTFAPVIEGPASLAVTNGVLTLSSANTYTGGTTIAASVYAGASGCFGSGPVNLQKGLLRSASTAARSFTNAVNIVGDMTYGYDGSLAPGTLTFSGPATLFGSRRVHMFCNTTFTLTLSGGVGESAPGSSLVVAGTDRDRGLTIGGTLSYTGPTFVNSARLRLTGLLSQSPYLEVNFMGYDNLNGRYDPAIVEVYRPLDNLIADDVPVKMRGGSFLLTTASGVAAAETVGEMDLEPGTSFVGAYGNNSAAALTIAALTRHGGAAIFRGSTTGSGSGKVLLPGMPAGFMGGWAMYSANAAGSAWDWAVYDAAEGVVALATYETGDEGAAWSSDKNVKMTDDQSLTASRTINSLVMESASVSDNARNLTIAAPHVLTVASGGVMMHDARANASSIPNGDPRLLAMTFTIGGNGTLTAGASTGRLYVNTIGEHTWNKVSTSSVFTRQTEGVIDANIVDNGGNSVMVVKSGSGNLTLGGTNRFTGGMVVNSGRCTLTTANEVAGTFRVAPGATLRVSHTNALGAAVTVDLQRYGDKYGMVNLVSDATVNWLTTNGVFLVAPADYTSATLPNYLTGASTLHVLGILPPSGTVIILR